MWVLEICIGRHLFPASRLLGGLLDSAARKTVTSIGLFGLTARSTTLATPPCIRYGIRHQNRAESGTLVETGCKDRYLANEATKLVNLSVA